MVAATRSICVDFAVFFESFFNTAESFSGFFQMGKYSDAVVRLFMRSFLVVMNAAFVFAPPMSKPMTFTVCVCLLKRECCVVVFVLCRSCVLLVVVWSLGCR